MYFLEAFDEIANPLLRHNTSQEKNIAVFLKAPFPGNKIGLAPYRTVDAVWNQPCLPAILFLKIFLFSTVQNNDFVCKTNRAFLSHMYKLGSQTVVPFFTGPVNPVDGTDYSFSEKFGQPAEKRRAFRMDMYHIIISKCSPKCRKKRCCKCRKAFFLYGKNITDINSLIFMQFFFVKLCTTDMMSSSVKTGYMITLLNQACSQFLYNDLNSAFPGRNSLMSKYGNIMYFFHCSVFPP